MHSYTKQYYYFWIVCVAILTYSCTIGIYDSYSHAVKGSIRNVYGYIKPLAI